MYPFQRRKRSLCRWLILLSQNRNYHFFFPLNQEMIPRVAIYKRKPCYHLLFSPLFVLLTTPSSTPGSPSSSKAILPAAPRFSLASSADGPSRYSISHSTWA
jgi:hypothetical protein